jgi:beta-xylosidase
MTRRLLKTTVSIVLAPLLYFGLLALIGLATHQTIGSVVISWQIKVWELGFLPYAAINGFYPTLGEINRMTLLDYGFIGGFVSICWMIASLVILFIVRRTKLASKLKPSIIILIIIASIGLSVGWRITHAPTPLPDTPIIQVDASKHLGEFPSHQRGFSQGGEGQMMQQGYFKKAMNIMSEIHPAYIRIDHLYDYYGVLSFDDEGQAVYDFSELDRIVNAIIDAGAEPLMTLSYTPPALANGSVYIPPTDLDAWEALVYETVKYYNVERGLNIQYWELWNEPNHTGFWNGTIQEYLDLYSATVRGLKRADPSAWIGGPATASSIASAPTFYRFEEENWFTALINHANKNNLPLDFVSWHLYSTAPQAYALNISIHEDWLSNLDPRPPMLLTEWNIVAGKSATMDNGKSVSHLAQTLSILSDSNLEQAYYFEPIDGGDDWVKSWGLIRADGTQKASYYAFSLFDQLDGIQLFIESNHPNIGAMASQSDDVVILVWNNTASSETASLLVDGMTVTSATINVQGVDESYGNPYYEQGTTDTFIEEFVSQATEEGQLNLHIDLPAFSIRLIEINE